MGQMSPALKKKNILKDETQNQEMDLILPQKKQKKLRYACSLVSIIQMLPECKRQE